MQLHHALLNMLLNKYIYPNLVNTEFIAKPRLYIFYIIYKENLLIYSSRNEEEVMKKTIIALLFSILTFLGMGISTVNAETIYTSLPDKDDEYYQPYAKAINSFNAQLQNNAVGSDNFTALTTDPQDFHTTNFNYPDIWIRDVAPVITTRMVKFKYSPNYLKKSDSHYLNKQFTKFLNDHYDYRTSKLKLDGGNVQWNGSDTVVVTKQVLKDNPLWSKKDIIDELKYQLDIKHVILISPEPGDVLGHSDGMVKFISAHKMYINDFSYEPRFLKTVEKEILAVDPDMKFVVLPSSYTDKGQYDKKIASARGLYINMLETKDAIYFPQYGLKNDNKAMKIVEEHTDKKVIPIQVGKLSTTGGSVHCMTWEVPDSFN